MLLSGAAGLAAHRHAQIWKPQVKKPSTALHAALE
jgi:hypothetical protein